METLIAEPTELASDRPNLIFEEGSYSITELLSSHLLPVVAQYDSETYPLPFNEFNFDLSQPLLLYKKRNIQKVAARSLFICDGKYEEVGDSLLIPEDYKGWFAVLQRVTGSSKADDTVPHFTSVEELANSNTEKFLIGGTKKLNGLQILDRSEGHLKHQQQHFFPGDTLTREKIYYGDTKKRTRLFRKPKYITEKFLMCRDESEREILLPFEQAGIFYQVSHKGGKANRNVMQMSDIVARKLTPRIIKLVFGRFPVTQCSFTGLMKAESSSLETSVIASTIVNTKNILLEMPVSSDIQFRIAVTNDELRLNSCFRGAMSMCAEKASSYMRNIKVCYNFTTDDSDMDAKRARPDISDCMVPYSSMTDTCIHDYENSYEKLTCNDTNNASVSYSRRDSQQYDDMNGIRSFQSLTTRQTSIPNIRYSEDHSASVNMRPARSSGRLSFCFGNSYLTVPMFESDVKRNSGNNNSNPVEVFTTRRGSRISFNGKFFEEVEHENKSAEDANSEEQDVPPPIPCTNIDYYVNAIAPLRPTKDSDDTNYIPITNNSRSRRPSTLPPEVAPPPLPYTSASSVVASRSESSDTDEATLKRSSSEPCEYDVPKLETNTRTSNISKSVVMPGGSASNEQKEPRLRRPSTFTFSEGCLPPMSKLTGSAYQSIQDVGKKLYDDDSPIYENIHALVESVAQLENRDNEFEETSSKTTSDINKDVQAIDTKIVENKETSEDLTFDNGVTHQSAVVDSYTELSDKINYELSKIQDNEDEALSFTSDVYTNSNETLKQPEILLPTRNRLHSHSLGVVENLQPISEVVNDEGLLRMDTQNKDNNSKEEEENEEEKEEHDDEEEDIEAGAYENVPEKKTNNKNMAKQNLNEKIISDNCQSTKPLKRIKNCEPSTNRTESTVASDTLNSGDSSLEIDNRNKVQPLDAECNEDPEERDVEIGEYENVPEKRVYTQRMTEKTTDKINVSRKKSDKRELTPNRNIATISVAVVGEHTQVMTAEFDDNKSQNSLRWSSAIDNLRKTDASVFVKYVFGGANRNIFNTVEDISTLSVDAISQKLKAIGIKDASIKKIKAMGVNGAILSEVSDDETKIRECLKGVNLVDQQKISMFVRGWRPNNESK